MYTCRIPVYTNLEKWMCIFSPEQVKLQPVISARPCLLDVENGGWRWPSPLLGPNHAFRQFERALEFTAAQPYAN